MNVSDEHSSDSALCFECGASLSAPWRYCPQCGERIPIQLRSVEKVTDKLGRNAGDGVPKSGITVQFKRSTAGSYPLAVRAARLSSDYRELGAGTATIHQATFDKAQPVLVDLIAALKGIRRRRVWVDGNPVAWDDAFAWLWCYERRAAAHNANIYCYGAEQFDFNLWGCIYARVPLRGRGWFTQGTFDAEGTFYIDKERVKHEVGAALRRLRLCPALDMRTVEAVVSALPDAVDPRIDEGWEYHSAFPRPRPQDSIYLATRTNQRGYEYQERVNGVSPKSLDAARPIFERIGKRFPLDELR